MLGQKSVEGPCIRPFIGSLMYKKTSNCLFHTRSGTRNWAWLWAVLPLVLDVVKAGGGIRPKVVELNAPVIIDYVDSCFRCHHNGWQCAPRSLFSFFRKSNHCVMRCNLTHLKSGLSLRVMNESWSLSLCLPQSKQKCEGRFAVMK